MPTTTPLFLPSLPRHSRRVGELIALAIYALALTACGSDDPVVGETTGELTTTDASASDGALTGADVTVGDVGVDGGLDSASSHDAALDADTLDASSPAGDAGGSTYADTVSPPADTGAGALDTSTPAIDPDKPCTAMAASHTLKPGAHLIGDGVGMTPPPSQVQRHSWNVFEFTFASVAERDTFPGAPGELLILPPTGCTAICAPGDPACPPTCVYGSWEVLKRANLGATTLIFTVQRIGPLQAFATLDIDAWCRVNGPQFTPTFLIKGDASNSVNLWLDTTIELLELAEKDIWNAPGTQDEAKVALKIELLLKAAGYARLVIKWNAKTGYRYLKGEAELNVEAGIHYNALIEGQVSKTPWKGKVRHLKTFYLPVTPWLYVDIGLTAQPSVVLAVEGSVGLEGDLGTVSWGGKWGATASQASWGDKLQVQTHNPTGSLKLTKGGGKPKAYAKASLSLSGVVDLGVHLGVYGSGGPFVFKVSPEVGLKAELGAKSGLGSQLCVTPWVALSAGVGLELGALSDKIEKLTLGWLDFDLDDAYWTVFQSSDIQIKSAEACLGCKYSCDGACLEGPPACQPAQTSPCSQGGSRTCLPDCGWGVCSTAPGAGDPCMGKSDGARCVGNSKLSCVGGKTVGSDVCLGCKGVAAGAVSCVGPGQLHLCAPWPGGLDGQPVITQDFGVTCGSIYGPGCHTGTDYGLGCDTKLVAPCSGTLTLVPAAQSGGHGNQIRIVCLAGGEVRISHLNSFAVGLTSGQQIVAGAALGKSGNTGFVIGASGCHIHNECRVNGALVDCLYNPAVVWHTTCDELKLADTAVLASTGASGGVCEYSVVASSKPGWWCDGSNVVLCGGAVLKKVVACPTGVCVHEPLGTNDHCEVSIPVKPPVLNVCAGAQCDDANLCTDDTCDPTKGCQHTKTSGLACNDGDACTAADLCIAGTCKGKAISCDGSNPCTSDSCDPTTGCQKGWSGGGACDDGNPCTEDDACTATGGCAGTPKTCVSGVCSVGVCGPKGVCTKKLTTAVCDDGDPCNLPGTCKDGDCKTTPVAAGCDDNNACTLDACDGGKCAFVTAGAVPCSDGRPCTQGDSCVGKACRAGVSTCVDKGACSVALCAATGCVYPVKTNQPCFDGNLCTQNDLCAATGTCLGEAVACDDGDVCTTDSCDQSTGKCSYAPTQAQCDDGDACTANDSCAAGACVGVVMGCDDGQPCTKDACQAGSCVHQATSAPCSDGDACTLADTCHKGVCVGSQQLACDDGNPCTANACAKGKCTAKLSSGGVCNDENPCTKADVCAAGFCHGAPVSCNDNKPCTKDWCKAGLGCQHSALTVGSCEDGDPCTLADSCEDGVCVGGKSKPCDDGNPCTKDACTTKGACAHQPLSSVVCDDGNACTVADVCKAGVCAGAGKKCEDGNACTTNACDPKTQICAFVPHNGACDDGDDCTPKDVCNGGVCLAGKQSCDDGKPCTADSCLKGQCVHLALSGPSCDDGDPCTLGDGCASGACVASKTKVCSDANPCTKGVCGKGGTCAFTPISAACEDGSACTAGDLCLSGACKAGKTASCDDGLLCTVDSCDSAKGCVYVAAKVGTTCDDGSACTTGDACKAGKCVPGVSACDDGKPCTKDLCLDGGCAHKPAVNAPCSDGKPCTGEDRCDAKGVCSGKVQCGDGDPCTVDTCGGPSNTCSHDASKKQGQPCDDSDACTVADTCGTKGCAGKPTTCDDGKPCTKDSCDPLLGCTAKPSIGSCEDGDPCTHSDTCSGGVCKPGAPFPCNDGNQCTQDTCAKGVGCTYAKMSGSTCNDGNPCTPADACVNGACKGAGNKPCSGDGPCIQAVCLPWQGCTTQSVKNGTACSDGDACTEADNCANGTCKGATKTCSAAVCYDAKCVVGKGCQSSPSAEGASCQSGGKLGQCNGKGACLQPQKTLYVDGCEGSAYQPWCKSASCYSCVPSSTDYAHSGYGSFSAKTSTACFGASCFDRIPGAGWAGSAALYLFTKSQASKGYGKATWSFAAALSGEVKVWMWVAPQTASIAAGACSAAWTVYAKDAVFHFEGGTNSVSSAPMNLQKAAKGAFLLIYQGDLTGVTSMWVDNQASPNNGCTVIPVDVVKVAP